MLTVEAPNKKYLLCPACSRQNSFSSGTGSWMNPSTTHPITKCPNCKVGDLDIRIAKSGVVFLGCSVFPKCKTSAFLPNFVKRVLNNLIP